MTSILLSCIILMIRGSDTTDQGMHVHYDYNIANAFGQQVTMFVYKNDVRNLS